MIKDNLVEVLHEMEEVTKLFKLEPFDIYIIGGGACILGEYTTRATLDIDFVDLGYPAKYGKVFTLLRDYDMLEYQSTILSPKYKERATKLKEFKYINVYILPKEDVAVSKIIRLAQKDIEDLREKFSEFYNYKDEVFQKVSECIMDISVEIAKKIINKEIETDKNAIISIIKGVVEEVNKTEDKITLKVMPKDVELVRDKLPELFSGDYYEAKILVVPDNNIKDGGVIVETSNGIIDATIATQLAIIEKALKTKEES